MTNELQLIHKFFEQSDTFSTLHSDIRIKKINSDQQIVFGEVYAPEIVDAHGEVMDAESVVQLAHNFLIESKNYHIDLMHNNEPVKAALVESFIARQGDPDYAEGAWVVGTKIFDSEIWDEIKQGRYNGYSMEALVHKEKRTIEMRVQNQLLGFTEENDGHTHAFYVEVDDNGRVIKGETSEDAGHKHIIKASSATEMEDSHAHRFMLQ